MLCIIPVVGKMPSSLKSRTSKTNSNASRFWMQEANPHQDISSLNYYGFLMSNRMGERGQDYVLEAT